MSGPSETADRFSIRQGEEVQAEQTAALLAGLFDLPVRKGKKSYFAGSLFECVRVPFRGTKGHIALFVSDLAALLESLQQRGIAVDIDETTEYDACGHITNIYLHDEIAGFSIHLMQK